MIDPPLCKVADPNPQTPRRAVPAGACDCHFHVFDTPSPQINERSYTAPRAPLAEYKNVQSALGLQRGVIVQPSIYGTDNRTTLNSVSNDGLMKAIVVVDDDTSLETLARLNEQEAVGVRINMLFASDARLNQLAGLAGLMADLGWHLQVLADVSALPNLVDFVTSLPVPVVFDHMGHVDATKGVSDPGFQTLLRLLDGTNVWVKLSGAYRMSTSYDDSYQPVAPMAKALIAANPDQLVWGSDWPHPSFEGPMPNDGQLMDLLFDWADPNAAHKILVANPERLYGFSNWETNDGR